MCQNMMRKIHSGDISSNNDKSSGHDTKVNNEQFKDITVENR